MPSKAQNAVFNKHGVRKGVLYRRMTDRLDNIYWTMQSFTEPLTDEQRNRVHELVDAQAADQVIYREYCMCDESSRRRHLLRGEEPAHAEG